MEFYLSGNGRVSLGQYWLKWMLPVFGFYIVFGIILGGLGLMSVDPTTGQPGAGFLVLYLPMLLLIWPSFAIGAKRLHDIGWNGWLMLLSLIPIASLVILVVTWFIPGNQGENKYGPDPRGA